MRGPDFESGIGSRVSVQEEGGGFRTNIGLMQSRAASQRNHFSDLEKRPSDSGRNEDSLQTSLVPRFETRQ